MDAAKEIWEDICKDYITRPDDSEGRVATAILTGFILLEAVVWKVRERL